VYQNILKYKKHRYLNVSLLLLIASIVLYLTQGTEQPANGGTWQGYTLGIFATILILLLTYLGIRKRSYSSRMGTVEGWTSAHVFLGTSLLLIATLHAAFQVGWNVHTLAYVLLIIVILSGFYGLFTYMHYPHVMSKNNSGSSQDKWLQELAQIDDDIKNLSSSCRADIRLLILSAVENTKISGSLFSQLRGKDNSKIKIQSISDKLLPNKNQQRVISFLATALPNSINRVEASALDKILSKFSRRQRLLKIVKRNLQIKAYLRVWLLFHIPLTIALIAALTVHILVVFIYW
jgi:hypothetical protein